MNENNPNLENENSKIPEQPSKTGILGFLERVGTKFSKTFLTPSIITVVITAILGPMAISWVNNDLKNKELQQVVISEILNYTNDADFAKTEAIEKIGIIAKMVDENYNVFGLSFAQTDSAFKDLYRIRNEYGIATLTEELSNNESQIENLKVKLTADSSEMAGFLEKKVNLEKELKDLKNNSDLSRAERKKQEEELRNQIQKKELSIANLLQAQKNYEQQLDFWTEQKNVLSKNLDKANEQLENAISENQKQQEQIQQFKDLVEQKEDDTEKLQEALKDLTNKHQSVLKEMAALKKQLERIQKENVVLKADSSAVSN